MKSLRKSVPSQVLNENSVRPVPDEDNGKKLVKKLVVVGIHLHQGQDQDSYGKIIVSKKLKNEQSSQFHSNKLMKLTKNTLQLWVQI